EDVVADLGMVHGGAHGRSRSRHGVAAEVDHVSPIAACGLAEGRGGPLTRKRRAPWSLLPILQKPPLPDTAHNHLPRRHVLVYSRGDVVGHIPRRVAR